MPGIKITGNSGKPASETSATGISSFRESLIQGEASAASAGAAGGEIPGVANLTSMFSVAYVDIRLLGDAAKTAADELRVFATRLADVKFGKQTAVPMVSGGSATVSASPASPGDHGLSTVSGATEGPAAATGGSGGGYEPPPAEHGAAPAPSGEGGGGSFTPSGRGDDRANANWENSNYDARVRSSNAAQRRTAQAESGERLNANWENSNYDAKARASARSARSDERRTAQAESGERLNANWENSNYDAKARASARSARSDERRTAQAESGERLNANWENSNYDAKARNARKIATTAAKEQRQYVNAHQENEEFDRKRNILYWKAQKDNERFDSRNAVAAGSEFFGTQADRDAAEYENNDRDLKYKYMRASADRENAEFDRKNNPPAERNGAGGFNVRDGAGHLLERAGRHGGMGEATGILGYALTQPELLPAIALGALAFSPQISGLMNSAFQSATSSYREPAISAYNVGRAGGFDAQGTVDFFGNPLTDKSLMKRFMSVGLAPADAMKMQSQYGIGAQSQDGLDSNLLDLQRMAINPTLGNMDQSQLIGAQRSITAMGLGGSVSQNSSQFADMLADANAKGYDKSIMVNSMMSSLTSLVSTGALGASESAAAGFVKSFADTGTAGGRDGTAAASWQSGLQNFAANPLATSFSGAVANRLAGKFQSMEDFKKYAPTVYAEAMDGNHPLLKQEITDYLSAPRPFQVMGIGSILDNDTTNFGSMVTGIVTPLAGGPGLAADLAVANITGTSVPTVMTAPAAATNYSNTPLGRIKNPDQLAALEAAAAKYHVDPNVLAAQYYLESRDGTNISTNKGKDGKGTATGYFQFTDGTWANPGFGIKGGFSGSRDNFNDSVNAAAQYDSALFANRGESAGLDVYGGKGYSNLVASTGVALDAPVGAQQQQLLDNNSLAGFSEFTAAKATFDEFGSSVAGFTQAVNTLLKGLGMNTVPMNKKVLNGNPFSGGRL